MVCRIITPSGTNSMIVVGTGSSVIMMSDPQMSDKAVDRLKQLTFSSFETTRGRRLHRASPLSREDSDSSKTSLKQNPPLRLCRKEEGVLCPSQTNCRRDPRSISEESDNSDRGTVPNLLSPPSVSSNTQTPRKLKIVRRRRRTPRDHEESYTTSSWNSSQPLRRRSRSDLEADLRPLSSQQSRRKLSVSPERNMEGLVQVFD